MNTKPRVIALGFFDGVHRGHGALLQRVVSHASTLDARACAFTFDRHPASFISGVSTPLLTTLDQRKQFMQTLYSIEEVIVGNFQEMMQMPWDSYIKDYLVKQLAACHLVVGSDFRFGYRGLGDAEKLVSLSRQLGIGCSILDKLSIQGTIVSSTEIRTRLIAGDLDTANTFLGHSHTLSGTVQHGNKLGTGVLGFPTVNLHFPDEIVCPAYGVYATLVEVDGEKYPAVTNVGVRPTVGDGKIEPTAESFLFDFSGNLYGKKITTEFHLRLRDEQKFNSFDDLKHQISADAARAAAWFDTWHNKSET